MTTKSKIKFVAAIAASVIVLMFLYRASARIRGAATFTVDTRQTGETIPRTFLGFSHDWGQYEAMMGTPANGVNPIYRQLIANLFEYGGGPVVMRIGGNSTDLLEADGEPNPKEISAYSQFSKDANAQFYLSVNLGSNDTGLPARQARYFIDNMPTSSLKAIEIGNEPDLYASNDQRPASYSFDDYLREFQVRQSGLQAVLPPGLKLMGPSWAMSDSLRNLPRFLNTESDKLAIVSQHWYAGLACGGRKNPPDFLLNPSAATSGAFDVASAVTLTHGKKLNFRIGEMNSIACNGESGVTDTFASALWITDSLFELVNAGVDGVNVHMDTDDVYGPFLFDVDTSSAQYRYSVKVIRPEYYGLLFFQEAAPGGSTLLPATASSVANLKNWVTVDGQNVVRITVINKGKKAARKVTAKIRGYGSGTLVRMLAPSFQAKSGITLGGISFDDSSDGKARGTPKSETVVPVNGTYEIQVPPTSAALLVLKRP